MSKSPQKKTTKKRQSAKSGGLPLSSSKETKKTKRKATAKPKSKPVKTHKKVAPKVTKSNKVPSTKRPPVKKQRELRLWLSPNYRLSISVQHKKAPSKKAKQRKKSVKQKRSLFQRRGVSMVMILFGVVGAVYFGVDVIKPAPVLSVYSPPVPYANISQPSVAQLTFYPRSQPTRLQIENISLDTSISTVGKQPNGTMEVPKSASTVSWYQFSPTPGEQGPSVIVGHVDDPKGPAVFWRLRELTPGQLIKVTRADGSVVTFTVTDIQQFDQNNFPTKEVYGNIGHAGLRLITCGGTFNKLTGNYDQNTVVFASVMQL